jgi:hypothetical protein
MRPRSNIRQSKAGLALVAFALVLPVVLSLAGCGSHEAPVAPKAGFESDAATPAPGPTPTPTTARKPETITVIGAVETIERSAAIKAKEGGVIVAGRHRLTVPAGALKNDTVIVLKDVSGSVGYVACEAYPEGLEFQKPVLLETSIGDLRHPFGFTIYWIANPGQPGESWLDMTATTTADGTSLAAWLTHFSTYAPGKAGWQPRRGGPGHFRNEQQ